MTISKTSKCPSCGGELKHYDHVRRIVRTKGGNKCWIKIARRKCVACKGIRRVLPDYIFPYKHYDAEIIRAVLEGHITSDTLGFEDYPSESTISRWTRK